MKWSVHLNKINYKQEQIWLVSAFSLLSNDLSFRGA